MVNRSFVTDSMFSNFIPCTKEIKSYPRLLPNNVEPMHPEYFSHVNIALGARGGGNSHMKLTGMLVVSLRGVNCRFWSRLGFSEYSIVARSSSFAYMPREISLLFRFYYWRCFRQHAYAGGRVRAPSKQTIGSRTAKFDQMVFNR